MRKLHVWLGALLVLGGLSSSLSAQFTLQYNRTLLVNSSQTVPSGKVWKVESAFFTTSFSISTGTTSSQSNTSSMLVNGGSVFLATSWGNSNATSSIILTKLPVWLPAGTTLAPGTNVSNLSVIEFNEIP